MTTHDASTGQSPPEKRLTSAAPCNDMRPKLFARLTPSGLWAWDKYNKRPKLITREEIEAYFAECKAWSEQCQAGQDEPCEESERPDIAV